MREGETGRERERESVCICVHENERERLERGRDRQRERERRRERQRERGQGERRKTMAHLVSVGSDEQPGQFVLHQQGPRVVRAVDGRAVGVTLVQVTLCRP